MVIVFVHEDDSRCRKDWQSWTLRPRVLRKVKGRVTSTSFVKFLKFDQIGSYAGKSSRCPNF